MDVGYFEVGYNKGTIFNCFAPNYIVGQDRIISPNIFVPINGSRGQSSFQATIPLQSTIFFSNTITQY